MRGGTAKQTSVRSEAKEYQETSGRLQGEMEWHRYWYFQSSFPAFLPGLRMWR